MAKSSFLKDMLVMIGALPIERPLEIKQDTGKRMGYPVNYLIHFSNEQREQMRQETDLLMKLID